jgi:hypothetical protein
MSNKKHSDTIITNEQTLQRRAWIERALDGVRGTLLSGEDGLEIRRKPRPRLYVVGSSRVR